MNLCSDGHEEIVHEGRTCPVCDKQEELDRAKQEIDDLESEVQDLNRRIQELEEDKE
jgi:transcription initiation factor IIE alpha subunit